MMHLRDIEEVFGRNALRLLASLDVDEKPRLGKARLKAVTYFFETEDPVLKDKIRMELLVLTKLKSMLSRNRSMGLSHLT
jgi:hypothetical protein